MGDHHYLVTSPVFYDAAEDVDEFQAALERNFGNVRVLGGLIGSEIRPHAFAMRYKDFDNGWTLDTAMDRDIVPELTGVLKHDTYIVIAHDNVGSPEPDNDQRTIRWLVKGRGK